MADDRLQDVINSPWLQLGVPIASTIATAIAPRHAGPASAMALGGLRTVDAYGASRARLRQQMLLHQQGLDKAAADDAEFDSLIDGDAASGEPTATEGGTAPESMANGKTQSLEHGVVPRMTQPSMSAQDAALLKRLHRIDPKGAQRLYEDRVGMRQKQDFEESGAIDPAAVQSTIPNVPGLTVSDIRLKNHMKGSFNPPAPHYVGGHEGGRQIEKAITEGDPNVKTYDIGEHDAPAERAPKFMSFVEGGKHVGVFITPEGIQKKFVVGTKDSSPEEMATNLRNKLALRSVGKPTGDATFDQQFANPKEADELLKKLAQTNMADVMMELVKSKGGPEPVPGN